MLDERTDKELIEQVESCTKTMDTHWVLITKIYSGEVLLTPESLLQANAALMAIQQYYFIANRAFTIMTQRANQQHDRGLRDSMSALKEQLHEIRERSMEQAKEISRWASIKIDGSWYAYTK